MMGGLLSAISAAEVTLPEECFLLTQSDLNKFAQSQLQPNMTFNTARGVVTDRLASFLKNDCRTLSVAQVFVGGSLKKGTAIRGHADLDVVVFLNNFRSMDNYLDNLPHVLDELRAAIDASLTQIDGRTRHALKIKLKTQIEQECLEVDVLPAYRNVPTTISVANLGSLYAEIQSRSAEQRQYYSSSLSQLQVDFVQEKIKNNPNTKNLIRLLKYWRKTCLCQPGRLPNSYFIELLTIDRWERAGSPVSFSMEVAFKDIMLQLVECGNIDVHWTTFYHESTIEVFKTPGKPYVLDPANPFNDVCAKFQGWEQVARMAQLSCDCPLLRDVSVTSSWMKHRR